MVVYPLPSVQKGEMNGKSITALLQDSNSTLLEVTVNLAQTHTFHTQYLASHCEF